MIGIQGDRIFIHLSNHLPFGQIKDKGLSLPSTLKGLKASTPSLKSAQIYAAMKRITDFSLE
jgi:hypothetical protein